MRRSMSMRRSMLVLSLVSVIFASICFHSSFVQAQSAKPKLTLDEFFNSVSFTAVKVSPDGNSVVIGTEKADWDQQIFRKELWLYRTAGGSLVRLTQSGHDSSPQWSPDGQWIAFLSERKIADAKNRDAGDDKDKEKDVAQLFLISPSGGEAFAVTSGADEIHAFAWSEDSKAIYFSSRQPWNKRQNDDHKKDWKDVILYTGDERGDLIFRITLDEAVELNLEWAPDNRHLFFQVNLGSLERKYEDPQPRLYWVDTADAADKKQVQRWFADYPGEVVRYTPLPDGSVLCACRIGTEVQLASQANPKAAIVKRAGWAGTYETPAAAAQSQNTRLAFVYSATERPAEVYIAEGPDKLAQAQPITSFNKLFTERELPRAKPYRWTSDDGTSVEGMLMYPPGKFEAKNLPMFVFIHGGPQDADGNHFEADWYQWDRLAATAGWLVFEPNYRGSTGYGDKFALQIVPEIVSRPGKDILTGVDALVKDGIADANQLAVGGYSYGGFSTNSLFHQTHPFKTAVPTPRAVGRTV